MVRIPTGTQGTSSGDAVAANWQSFYQTCVINVFLAANLAGSLVADSGVNLILQGDLYGLSTAKTCPFYCSQMTL